MRRSAHVRKLGDTALGSAICSVAITLVQLLLLWATGSMIIHDLNGQVLRVLVQMYIGSFIGLFSIFGLTSSK